MIYLYESPIRPARLVVAANGQPSLCIPVDPVLYASIRPLALEYETILTAAVHMALHQIMITLEERPPTVVAPEESVPSDPEDDDFPY